MNFKSLVAGIPTVQNQHTQQQKESESVQEGTSSSKKTKLVVKSVKHIKPRFVISKMDIPFLALILALLAFGIIMMSSASFAWGFYDAGDGYYYVKRQALFAAGGILIMFIVSFFDYHFFLNTKVAFGIFGVVWLLNLFTSLFGKKVADASRWISIGGIQFQPSELLKIAFIIIIAYIVAVNSELFKTDKYSCIVPFGIIIGASAGVLVLQRHLSAVMLIGIIGLALMFISGMPRKNFWLFVGIIAGAGILLLGAKMLAGGSGFSYISERIQSWQNPTSDPTGSTYQTYNSLLAIGSGGWTGLGFGESRQKYLYLPEAQNDFIFSIICEELGFVGAMVVILLFLMFIIRGIYIAAHAKDKFGMIIAAGITIQIGLQAFLNIMVASNAFPNTGISLPFFSYGGTALLIQLAEMGLLLNISRQSNIKK